MKPVPAADGAGDSEKPCSRLAAGVALAVLTCVLLALFIGFAVSVVGKLKNPQDPEFSVAIAAIAGLDPATDLARPTLEPRFALAVRVTSRGYFGSGCSGVDIGWGVKVSYHGVKLAVAPLQNLCSSVPEARDQFVVAAGAGVPVPGAVLDSLAADMRRGAGEAAFDVTVTVPETYWRIGEYRVRGIRAQCTGRRVGDTAGLGIPCEVSNVDDVVPVLPPPPED